MKWLLLLTFLFVGCTEEERRYLFNEYDDEYEDVVNAAAQECFNDAKIVASLQETNTFSNFYPVGTVYRATKTTSGNTNKVYSYFKVIENNLGTLKIVAIYADTNLTDTVIEYTQSENDDIITTIGYGVCFNDDDYYDGSSLSSTDSITFVHSRLRVVVADDDDDDTEPEQYVDRKDSYVVDKDYPLVLHQFNGSVAVETKGAGDDNVGTVTDTYKLERLDGGESDSECTDDPVCDFSDTASLPTCNLAVDTDHYKKTVPDDALLGVDLTNC